MNILSQNVKSGSPHVQDLALSSNSWNICSQQKEHMDSKFKQALTIYWSPCGPSCTHLLCQAALDGKMAVVFTDLLVICLSSDSLVLFAYRFSYHFTMTIPQHPTQSPALAQEELLL